MGGFQARYQANGGSTPGSPLVADEQVFDDFPYADFLILDDEPRDDPLDTTPIYLGSSRGNDPAVNSQGSRTPNRPIDPKRISPKAFKEAGDFTLNGTKFLQSSRNKSRVPANESNHASLRSVSSPLPAAVTKTILTPNGTDPRRSSMATQASGEPPRRTSKKPRRSDPDGTVPAKMFNQEVETLTSVEDDDLLEFQSPVQAAKGRTTVKTQRKPTAVGASRSKSSLQSKQGAVESRAGTEESTVFSANSTFSPDPTKIFQDQLGRPISFCFLGSGPVERRLKLLVAVRASMPHAKKGH